MKRDTSYVIKRAEHFKSILTAEGFLVGIVAGLVVLLYRVLLEYAGQGHERCPCIWKKISTGCGRLVCCFIHSRLCCRASCKI